MLRYLAILPINQPFNFDIKDASLYLDSQKNGRFFDCQKSAWTSIRLLLSFSICDCITLHIGVTELPASM